MPKVAINIGRSAIGTQRKTVSGKCSMLKGPGQEGGREF